jgi:hypothetical protein
LVPVALGHAVENLNSQSFSRHTLYSVGQTQYIAFYAANTEVVVGRRTLGTTNWELQATGFHSNNDRDGHNIVSLGISGDGFLHLSWGMHGNPFHYARSVWPGSLAMVATNMTGLERAVTYPQFINCPDGDLLYLFRQGGSGSGDTFLNRYSATKHSWTNVNFSAGQQPLIKGVTGRLNCSAYPNYAGFDSQTNLHLTWNWRNQALGIEGNQDLLHARSPDFGVTWRNGSGAGYVLPITRFSADCIWPIATNHSLINMAGQCLDTSDRPVICTWWAPLGSGTAIQYSVIWNDGSCWRANQIGSRTNTSAQTWPGRPLILCDRQNRLWVVFSDPMRGNVPTLAWTTDPNRAEWHMADLTSEFMGNLATCTWGGWEPTHDPVVWERDGGLHLFYQPITGVTNGTPISVLEFDPGTFLKSQLPGSSAKAR